MLLNWTKSSATILCLPSHCSSIKSHAMRDSNLYEYKVIDALGYTLQLTQSLHAHWPSWLVETTCSMNKSCQLTLPVNVAPAHDVL